MTQTWTRDHHEIGPKKSSLAGFYPVPGLCSLINVALHFSSKHTLEVCLFARLVTEIDNLKLLFHLSLLFCLVFLLPPPE